MPGIHNYFTNKVKLYNTAVGYPYTVKVYCCDWWSKKLGRRYSGQRKEEEVEPRCAGSHQETQTEGAR